MAKKPLIKNASDEEQFKKASKKERFLLDQKKMDWKKVLSTSYGRRVLAQLLDYGGPYRSTFNPDNPHITSYRAGQQDFAHYIQAEIVQYAGPEYYNKLINEGDRDE